MIWKPVGRDSGGRLIDWLEIDEWKHTTLSAKIKNNGGVPIFGRIADGRLWIRNVDRHIDGVLYISRYGVVLPAFDNIENDDSEKTFLKRIFTSQRDNLFSIIGMESRVRYIESFIPDSPQDAESYRMLTLIDPPDTIESDLDITIKKATAADFTFLWSLERGYQTEEVLRKGSRLNERFAKQRFMETLKAHVVYGLWTGGKAVAKAQTNARGWTYEQIGGVYVEPKHRKKGYGRAVVKALISDIHRRNKGACLFVKKANLPALRLYENLGFQDKESFRISYY